MKSRVKPCLLGEDEPAAFGLVNPNGSSPVVLLCDHASCRVPRALHQLGLDSATLHSHIGWDAGALSLARQLSGLLDAALVFSGYSRLVIDCNRHPDSPESIPGESHAIPVPGNLDLSPDERGIRRAELFNPYHEAISGLLAARQGPVILIAIHSFTPQLSGLQRPWTLGVCHDPSRPNALARQLLAQLQAVVDGPVGDNQPYDIDPAIDYTLPHHAAAGHPHVMLEVRRDRLVKAGEVTRLAQQLCEVLRFF